MNRDRAMGALLLLGSAVIIVFYGYLLFFMGEELAILLLKLTAFIAVLGVFGILGWVGYTLATTPPPKSIEEIEKEIEEELKRLEAESEEQHEESR